MKYGGQLFFCAFNSKSLLQESKAFLLRLEELDPNQDAEKFGVASAHLFSASS
jgi:hypothetical protein